MNVREATESLEQKFQQISLTTKKEVPIPSVEKERNSSKQSQDLHCEFCQKSFTGAQSMREHEQSEKHRRKVETGKVSPPSNTDEKQNSDKHLKKVSRA